MCGVCVWYGMVCLCVCMVYGYGHMVCVYVYVFMCVVGVGCMVHSAHIRSMGRSMAILLYATRLDMGVAWSGMS